MIPSWRSKPTKGPATPVAGMIPEFGQVSTSHRRQWQPHAPPQQPPPEDDPEEDEPLEDFTPLPPWAAKTESCMVLFALAHFGQATFVLPFSTTRSYSAPQSSQTYS
jgi:hypothetical protein